MRPAAVVGQEEELRAPVQTQVPPGERVAPAPPAALGPWKEVLIPSSAAAFPS